MRVLVQEKFWFSWYKTKVLFLVEVFRLLVIFLEGLFSIEMSKTNQMQRRDPSFCAGSSAETIFGLACKENSSSLS